MAFFLGGLIQASSSCLCVVDIGCPWTEWTCDQINSNLRQSALESEWTCDQINSSLRQSALESANAKWN